MDHIPFEVEPSPVPKHSVFTEEIQYRAKLQKFSHAPSELTVQKISFERDVDRYRRAAENGNSSCFPVRRTKNPEKISDPESVERSQRRAKTRVRLLVTELAPKALWTFTTRKIYDFDQVVSIWEGFTRRLRLIDPDARYVAVPELHKDGRHWHVHSAMRTLVNRSTMRRIWHNALEAFEGRRAMCILRGADSPGNVDEQAIKGRDVLKRIRKVAKYISKYITKDLIEKFNRRRYWPSKGIDLADAQVFWLGAVTQGEAIREACRAFGVWDGVAPAFKAFLPSDRVFWMPFDVQHEPPF